MFTDGRERAHWEQMGLKKLNFLVNGTTIHVFQQAKNLQFLPAKILKNKRDDTSILKKKLAH